MPDRTVMRRGGVKVRGGYWVHASGLRHCVRLDVFGKDALPNVNTIAYWADACRRHGAELWISDVVANELVEHALQTHRDFLAKHDAHRNAVRKWGLHPGEWLPFTGDEISHAISDAGAVLVPLEGDDAREALLDQILLRGPGERKSGVKTGAADSAWIRSIIAKNGGDADGLIVVTGDLRALDRTCEQLGVDVPRHAANLGELRGLLGDSDAATEPWVSRFTEWMEDYFVTSSHGRSDGTPGESLQELTDLGFSNWWDVPSVPDDGYEAWQEQTVVVSNIQSVSIGGDIEHDRWTDSITAQVEFHVEVDEQYARQDAQGHLPEYATRRYPAAIRGIVQTFVHDQELRFDGQLEDVEFVRVDPDVIEWNLL